MRKITINVTQEHIDSGAQKSGEHCPIALTVLEKLGLSQNGPEDIILAVSDTHVNFIHTLNGNNYCSYKAKLPQVAIDFIECFDRNRNMVYPFSFELEVPV